MNSPSLAPFSCNYTPEVPEILAQLRCSLLLSTYQAGKRLLISPSDDGLLQLARNVRRPMFMAVEGNRLAVATQHEVILLENAPNDTCSTADEGIEIPIVVNVNERRHSTTASKRKLGERDVHRVERISAARSLRELRLGSGTHILKEIDGSVVSTISSKYVKIPVAVDIYERFRVPNPSNGPPPLF